MHDLHVILAGYHGTAVDFCYRVQVQVQVLSTAELYTVQVPTMHGRTHARASPVDA